ncbi:MAG: proline--tRNA ligase [Streptosporangiales bacterium]|nr:proline--tRNA ligase [Streptosporangiales bacterium]
MSSLFLRTLREDPADAEVPSHKLLVRAGYVRRAAAGIYSWLPLGKIALENVTRAVREEMDAIGAQEVLFPALLPREPYELTGRWTEYGDLLLRLKDRRGGDYLLGPTHEEMFTLMVKGEYSSYKDFPVILYQIQTKYRDEARPRSGILRGREFVMKDSYSFDLDDAGLQKSYDLHREAYIKIFDRLGFDYRIVSATSGAMGGSHSEEFLAPAPTGEDTFVSCAQCQYAANVEAVQTRLPQVEAAGEHPPVEVLDTPDTPTIEALVEFLGQPASAMLKNLLVKVTEGGVTSVVVVGVPADRDVDMDKLEAVLAPATVEIFEAEDFAARPDLVRGYVGPHALPGDVSYLADPRVAQGTAWVTGAGQVDKHARNVVAGRDFTVDRYVDVATMLPGDPCPRCGGPLSLQRGIEIGHIFQLGRKYTDAFQLDALGPDGKPGRVTMGSYGIGVSRIVAALAEQAHDDKGLIWPREVAPADVHIVATGKDNQIQVALDLAQRIEARGVRVLCDDRAGVSPGVKFTDAELIGVPTILIVGKGLAQGVVELRDRGSGQREDLPLEEAVDRVTGLVGRPS